ncbi:COG4648 family protein [Piscirickettsia litoralis]|uniref:Ketosynthase n=1 Tax=Piscirickettsia litoralis TaxID=1891921 RepID=A0ABX3A297_9GAMM|nr:hypothetical protein [Piscirickettsia litoralis]ODN42759.1 hypothetical protein BGC07_07260 [Piscirickettsia litoralis]
MLYLRIFLVIAYPLIIFLAIKSGISSITVLFLISFLLFHSYKQLLKKNYLNLIILFALLIALCFAFFYAHAITLKLTPAFINFAIAAIFLASLKKESPLIAQYAKLERSPLPSQVQAYCRQMTLAWGVFLTAQGMICILLSVYTSNFIWLLYTAIINYIITGLFFILEYYYRSYRFPERAHGLINSIKNTIIHSPKVIKNNLKP